MLGGTACGHRRSAQLLMAGVVLSEFKPLHMRSADAIKGSRETHR